MVINAKNQELLKLTNYNKVNKLNNVTLVLDRLIYHINLLNLLIF